MTLRLEEYLKDPCGTLSIPYWKWKAYAFSDMIEIVHKRDKSRSEQRRRSLFSLIITIYPERKANATRRFIR